MNPDALAMAFLLTAFFGIPLYLMAFDEPCLECDHSRWTHHGNCCTGYDSVDGRNITAGRACRCRGYKLPNERK